MPTNDERARVAQALREMETPTWPTLMDAVLGHPATREKVVGRLADLIEPDTTTDTTKTVEDTTKCVCDTSATVTDASATCDRDALLALADILRTPEQDADCTACPLRKWCETELYNGHSITCHECKTWHTADVIREACGGQTE